MTLSLFSKEQGATTLISLVLWDFLQHHRNVVNLMKKLGARERHSLNFTFCTVVLAIQTLATVYWQYLLNGPTKPDLIVAVLLETNFFEILLEQFKENFQMRLVSHT